MCCVESIFFMMITLAWVTSQHLRSGFSQHLQCVTTRCKAVIRVFHIQSRDSHLKCFSEQSSSQKASQLMGASHSLHLQPPPPLRSPFLPCPSSEVRSSGKSLPPYSFSSVSSIPPLLVLSRVLPAQPRVWGDLFRSSCLFAHIPRLADLRAVSHTGWPLQFCFHITRDVTHKHRHYALGTEPGPGAQWRTE